MDGYEADLNQDLELPFAKLGLKIGAALYLEAKDHAARYQVRMIGYLPNQSIIVTAPVVDGKQVVLKKDRPFTVRSLAQNNAFAFQSSIKSLSMLPYPYIHLEYPRQMLTIRVRNADRLEVKLPVRITSDFDIGNGEWPKEGFIYDLSRTGAGIRSEYSLGNNEDEIILYFLVKVAGVSKNFKLVATIRNKSMLEATHLPLRFNYGLQFNNLSDAAKIVLCGFIYELQAEQ